MPSYALSLLGLCALVAVAGVKLMEGEAPPPRAEPARATEAAPPLAASPAAPPPPPVAVPLPAEAGPPGLGHQLLVPEPMELPPQH